MSSSYSDLQTYRNCPRLFGFRKLGYTPIATAEPLATGGLVHIGLSAHLKGENTKAAIDLAVKVNLDCIKNNLSGSDRYDAELTIGKSYERAITLLKRYVHHWAKDYAVTLIEPEFELDGVVCHPDLIATYQGKQVIVDFKTSYHPDERWYDISNQCDLYTYIYNATGPKSPPYGNISLIIYDIISEEGLFRHIRPPRLEAGERLFREVTKLNTLVENVKNDWFLFSNVLLGDPHPDYTCPSRCSFFTPCWLLDTGSWEDCKDYLGGNYLHENS